MITWKPVDPRYGSGESTLGISFRENEPLLARQLSDEQGFYVDKKEITVDGYSYKVKVVVSKKDNRQYIFIERKQVLGDEKPEETAHKQTLKDYPSNNGDYEKRQAEIRQAHADNQNMHTEMMAAMMNQTAAMLAVANELQGLKHLFEIMVNESDAIKKSFKTAAEVAKTQ